MDSEYISTGKAARLLGVTPNTLRSWDKQGKLTSTRTPGGHRLFSVKKLQIFLGDSLSSLALAWLHSPLGTIPSSDFYCSNTALFQTRTAKLEHALQENPLLRESYSLIVAATSEIGNNSFDHNIGNWPDIPGIFFGYDLARGHIVLADRGQGILKTLKRVKPSLTNDADALETAFTEVLSGRAPEERGNGLKFVRRVVPLASMDIVFQSGTATASISHRDTHLTIKKVTEKIQGCFVSLTFKH